MVILESTADDACYALTLRKPRKGNGPGSHYATVRVKNTTLSSSADYNHCYTVDDVVYCHIIDPRTGCPINTPQSGGIQRGISTLTLLGDSAAENDAMTTALCVMGAQDALLRLQEIEDSGVMAVCSTASDCYEVLTNLDEGTLTIDDPAYVLSSARDGDRLVYTGTLLK